MNNETFWIYLVILAGSTYLIRVIPFVAIRNKIENRFIRSFLFYIPFAVLAAMTIPAIFTATGMVLSGVIALLVAALFAIKDFSLTVVAVVACVAVLITQWLVQLLG